jgi:hypothetical protein
MCHCRYNEVRVWFSALKKTMESTLTAEIHRETPLNINSDINNKRQDCKIGTVCVWGTCGGEGE